MGMITIQTVGSFGNRTNRTSAMEHGHAHAVQEAINWLVTEVLPRAINEDHRLHDEGHKPAKDFVKPGYSE